MPNHIVLYQPEIPANTGNISRTCAGTDTYLHLIRPLGFSTDDKMLKRAGLDYWDNVKLSYYDSLDEFFEKNEGGEFYYITKFGRHVYSDIDYSDPNKIISSFLEKKRPDCQMRFYKRMKKIVCVFQ